MSYRLKGALPLENAIFDAALRSSFSDEEIALISSVLNRASEIERDNGVRPTHVAVHAGTLTRVGRIWDLEVIRSPDLEPGKAYLLICSAP